MYLYFNWTSFLYLGHSDVVTVNDALRLANQTLYIVTAAGDCTVKLWIKSKNESKFLNSYLLSNVKLIFVYILFFEFSTMIS